MKKAIVVLAFLLVFSMLGCAAAEQGDKLPLGRLTKLGVSEETLNAKVAEGLIELPLFSGFRFFDTCDSMIAALDSGIVAAINVDEYMTGYLVSRTEGLVEFRSPDAYEYTLAFSMLLRAEDAELRDLISGAIADMKADGTIEALKARYIDDVIAGSEPEAVVPERFDGAKTLRVALTGDRPPMDYFSADGNPVGFNTALVAEIARRLKVNVEFVSVSTGARSFSLASNESDVVFWTEAGNFGNWENADTEDQPENTVVTEPYLTGELLYVVRADSPLAAR